MGFATADPKLRFQNWKIHAVMDLRLRKKSHTVVLAAKFPVNFVASDLFGFYIRGAGEKNTNGETGIANVS
jgi:hypothetical protein